MKIKRLLDGQVLLKSNMGTEKSFPIEVAQKVLDKSQKKKLWALSPDESRYEVKSGKIVPKKDKHPSSEGSSSD